MKNYISVCTYILLLHFLQTVLISAPIKMILSVPVAHLRATPKHVPRGLQSPLLSKDLGQQNSQILFGEKLILNDNDKILTKWIPVKAIEQEIITPTNKWTGCPGYIQKDQLLIVHDFPIYNIVLQDLWTPVYGEKNDATAPKFLLACGTMLSANHVDQQWWQVHLYEETIGFIKTSSSVYELSSTVTESEQDLRNKIVQIAKQFIGCSYVLGGRTPPAITNKKTDAITGIDCSAFVNIVFKAIGLQIPKNSTSQFYGLPKHIEHGKDLKPGDLIFFPQGKTPSRMRHVMLYLGKDEHGNDELIESTAFGLHSLKEAAINNIPLQDLCVRVIKLVDYFGIQADQIEAGKTIYKKHGCPIVMGSYLDSKASIQMLRDKLLSHT